MERYENGKIYRMVCNKSGKQYIGSTCQLLSQRLWKHKNHYSRFQEGKHNFYSVFEVLESNDYNIILVEKYPCKSKEELEMRERYWIENLDCVNLQVPRRTLEEKKDYRRLFDQKDEVKERKKDWYQNNKEKMQEYRDEHKERQSELSKDHYEKNKDDYKLRAKVQREKIKNDPELAEKEREYKKLKAREYREKKKKAEEEALKILDLSVEEFIKLKS